MPERDLNLDELVREATLFYDPECPPHFVSPSKFGPSNEVIPFLDLLFPNVPENAKQNNLLLKVEELNSIAKYLNSQAYCSDYDVTIVIDQGAGIEKEVRKKLNELGRKPTVNSAFNCCILTMINSNHEHAADVLAIRILFATGRFLPLMTSWGRTTTTLLSGRVSDFYRSFTNFIGPRVRDRQTQTKEGDSSLIDIYSELLCNALGMSAVPSLAVESANSDDIRKLFQDCISWLAGSYLRVNTVIGVNNSPKTYSVDILNFDSTVDNLLRLTDGLIIQNRPVTREALLLSAKMKASVIVLQLRLLQLLIGLPRGMPPTQEDVDAINEHLAEDIALAQRLCPDLEIKRLERLPLLDGTAEEFTADIDREILHHQNILNRPDIHDLQSQLHPRDAIVRATYALVHFTEPQTFGPISSRYVAPEGSNIRVPYRAACTFMGNGNVIITPNELRTYFRKFSLEPPMMDVVIRHNPIELEWINDPHALAIDRGIPQDQLTQENYKPNTTLDGHIKFRYLSDAGLREIARTMKASDVGDVRSLAWNIVRKMRQTKKRPFFINQPPTRSMHVVYRELGPPLNWIPSLTH